MANYLNNKDLLEELIKSKELDELTPKASEMFILLVDRIGRKFYYRNVSDAEDCRQTALLHLFGHWRNFDPNKSTNAFAYLTEITKRGFASGWAQITKQKGNNGEYIRHFSIETNMNGEAMVL